MKTTPEEIPTFKKIAAQINKHYGKNTIGIISEMEELHMQRISTGVTALDTALGKGINETEGLPTGRMVELYGLPSAGKSLVALKTIVEAQKQSLDCVFIDCENSFDPEFATLLGINVKKLYLSQISEGEDVIDVMCELLKSQPGLIVVDSVAAMVTTKEMEEPMEQQFMAPKARLLSRGLAKINALNKKTLIIWINQLRSTMALYGKPTTTTGGRALGHYASIRVEVKQGEKLTVDGKKTSEVIGQQVLFRIEKNKTAPPFRQGSFNFYYDGRIEQNRVK